MKQKVETKAAPAAIGPYSQAIRVGGWLFSSGQIPLDPATGTVAGEGLESQARQVFANIRAVLEEAGMTFDDVVKTTVFLGDMKQFPLLNEIYSEYFSGDCPARSCVEVSCLPKNCLVEIELVAHKA